MKRVWNTLIFGLLTVTSVGCGSSKSNSDHTHLWTVGQQQHVWSYERVTTATLKGGETSEPQAFLKREIRPGETLEFDGGAVVTYDGSQLYIGKQLIEAANVHVERDGSIRLNAFIRATD